MSMYHLFTDSPTYLTNEPNFKIASIYHVTRSYVASVCQQHLRIPCNCLCSILKYVATELLSGVTCDTVRRKHPVVFTCRSSLSFFWRSEGPSRTQLSLCKECHFHLRRWIMAGTHKSISCRLMSQVTYISYAFLSPVACMQLWRWLTVITRSKKLGHTLRFSFYDMSFLPF
jgi:hypothetical protein